MQLEHEFHVPVPAAQAWDVLLDVERIAPCMPGASVDSFDGENVEGKVKVKVGPIQVTYAGTAKFINKDEAAHRITIDAKGKEARGSGTAAAKILTQLYDEGQSTRVTVTTDLAITGKPAQFGRGVMVEVGNKLLGRFADCLAQEIAGGAAAPGEGAGGAAPAAGAGVGAGATANALDADSAAATSSAGSTGSTDNTGDTSSTVTDASAAATGTAPAAVSQAPISAATGSPSAQAAPAPPPRPVPRETSHDIDPLDLLDAAGPAVAKRLIPVLVGLLVLLIILRKARRR